MFRGRSDDKDTGSQRRSSGQSKGKGSKSSKGKAGQTSARANARDAKRKSGAERTRGPATERSRAERGRSERANDPRSSETGRKIRRIESGNPRQLDQTDIGGPPSRSPTRRPVADGMENGAGVAVPGGLANRTPSLPPLQQPTGEVPRIPVEDVAPDETVTIASGVSPDGVFGEDREQEEPQGRPLRAVPPVDDVFAAGSAVNEPRSVGDELDWAQAELRAADSDATSNTQQRDIRDIPSALPDFDDVPTELPQQAVMADQLKQDPVEFAAEQNHDAGDYAAVGVAAMSGEAGAAMAGRDPFDVPSQNQSPALAGAGRTRQSPPVDSTRAMPAGMGGGGGFDDPRSSGAPPTRRQDSGRPRSGERRDRSQDTEFKLADNRPRQKPKEPNRFLLAVGLGVVLLLGAAAAWYFTRGDSGTDNVASDGSETVAAEGADDETAAIDPATPEATVAPEPTVSEPTLFFDAAGQGPLQQGETYSIDLVGEPEGSMLQVVVDDIPQGSPDLLLPDLILPAGRHTIYIQMTNGAEVSQSTPVELYVLGDAPPQGFRANLSSVDMQTEGWAEAIRQFDEYRAAGHDALQLLPISPGYWNLFVGGLGEERSAAQSYCESFNLAVPDACFPTYYEPSAADTTATTVAESTDALTDEDPDAMTDEDTTSTTVAGG